MLYIIFLVFLGAATPALLVFVLSSIGNDNIKWKIPKCLIEPVLGILFIVALVTLAIYL